VEQLNHVDNVKVCKWIRTYIGRVKIFDDVGLVGLSLYFIESDTEQPVCISFKKHLVGVRYVFIFVPKRIM
jgi:hypothetical protein